MINVSPDYENIDVIGMNINIFDKVEEFEVPSISSSNRNSYKYYYVFGNFSFHKQVLNRISVKTDKNNIIEQLIYTFPLVLKDHSFYELINEVYGDPIHIYCIDNFEWEPIEEIGIGMIAQEGGGLFNSCTYQDDPYLIVWKYKDLYIEFERGEKTQEMRNATIVISKEGVMHKQ